MPDMNNLNMNLSAVRPPIAFAAKNARFVSNFPQGSDELWMADLKACRQLVMGVGYRNNDGKYELIGIDPEEDSWLESARSILPFDELCHPG